MAVYFALGAGLGRRLARRFPVPVAVALAFWAGEGARTILDPPLGMPWFQLGHATHAHLWLAEHESLIVLATGAFLGWFGSWFAAARHMRRIEPR